MNIAEGKQNITKCFDNHKEYLGYIYLFSCEKNTWGYYFIIKCSAMTEQHAELFNKHIK